MRVRLWFAFRFVDNIHVSMNIFAREKMIKYYPKYLQSTRMKRAENTHSTLHIHKYVHPCMPYKKLV